MMVIKLNPCQTLCILSEKGEGWDSMGEGEDNDTPLVHKYWSGWDWDDEL